MKTRNKKRKNNKSKKARGKTRIFKGGQQRLYEGTNGTYALQKASNIRLIEKTK